MCDPIDLDTPSLDLEALRTAARQAAERAGRATPGPWHPSAPPSVFAGSMCIATLPSYEPPTPANMHPPKLNAQFVAAARTDVPDLASSVLVLADEVERLRESITDCSGTCGL